MSKTLIPAAGYLRMSSDKQDTSIDDQRSELIAYAAKHGYKIVRWFSDEGIAGWKSKQRIGFKALIADAEEGEFKVVLCWDQSRFSRFDPMEANYYWHSLRMAGVYIETVKEGRLDFETLGGWLTASVQQHGKAEYCRSLAADVVRGRRRQILAGKWITRAPYGYRLDSTTGKLTLGPAEEVEVVRRIFKLRAKGVGRWLIARELTQDKVPSISGMGWNPSQVAAMLRRETYIGNMVIGKEPKGKFQHVVDEQRTIVGTHPPIIDQELWDKVQKVNGSIKRVPRRPNSPGHLSGLLFCGCCGRVMYCDSHRGLYICSSFHKYGQCSYNTIGINAAMQAVADKIKSALLCGSEEALTAEIEKQLAKRKATKQGIDAKAIERQLAELDRKIEQAAERMVLEDDTAVLGALRKALRAQQEKRAALAEKLTEAKATKTKPLTAKQIAAKLWELDRVLREGDRHSVRAALQDCIEKVVIDFHVRQVKSRRFVEIAGGTVFFCSNASMSSRRHTHVCVSAKAKTAALSKADLLTVV